MGNYTNRGVTLCFDEYAEHDIVNFIERLSESRKLSSFVNNLIRVVFDSEKEFADEMYINSALEKYISKFGLSADRSNFINEVSEKVSDISYKIDRIYEMCQHLYAAAQMGDVFELSKRADGMLASSFFLNSQVAELKKITKNSNMPVSNKVHEAQKNAKETFDYILKVYKPIIDEMKQRHDEAKQSYSDIGFSDETIKKLTEALSGSLAEAMKNVQIQVNGVEIAQAKPGVAGGKTLADDFEFEDSGDNSDSGDFSQTADLGALNNFFL